MSEAPVYLTRDGETATLVLNQPARRNAVSSTMWEAIPDLLGDAEADTDIRLLKVTGAGEHFAAGADISEFETVYATPESAACYSESISAALNALEYFARPTVAVIQGACVGGGVSLAAACDLRIAARSSRFAITPGKLGLVYSYDDVRRLIRRIGDAAAKDLLFSGRLINADEAFRLRLIDRVGDNLDTIVASVETEMLANSQWSLQAIKTMIRHVSNGERKEGDVLFLSAFAGEDFQSGFRAFLDRQKPDFKWRG
jgi:enoyl-CoA hydratase/carnithine racemase